MIMMKLMIMMMMIMMMIIMMMMMIMIMMIPRTILMIVLNISRLIQPLFFIFRFSFAKREAPVVGRN